MNDRWREAIIRCRWLGRRLSMNSIRILLASDLALLRAALRLMLDAVSGFSVVAEVNHPDELETQFGLTQPDVLVMSISTGTGFGSALIETLVQKHPQVGIVALSSHDETSFVRLLISAGVCGYVSEHSPTNELYQAIREAAKGKTYIDSLVAARAGQESLRKLKSDIGLGGPKRPAFLSRRETEVLKLLARGFTNQQVADNLLLSVKTAETHRARIMRKLNLSSLAELVRYALRNKIITDA